MLRARLLLLRSLCRGMCGTEEAITSVIQGDARVCCTCPRALLFILIIIHYYIYYYYSLLSMRMTKLCHRVVFKICVLKVDSNITVNRFAGYVSLCVHT